MGSVESGKVLGIRPASFEAARGNSGEPEKRRIKTNKNNKKEGCESREGV